MQETKAVVAQRQPGECIHHWFLGEPQRASVEGTCRRCGAHRAFPAGFEVPAPAPEGEEEPVLDLTELASAVSSLGKHALI